MKMKRLVNAALGLGLGVVTLPLAAVLWPAICMWFFWHETDDNANEDSGEEA